MSTRHMELIARAYGIIGTVTPVPADCGKLCGSVCCKGEDKGMLLFPGETEMLGGIPGYKIYRINYMGAKSDLLMCDGKCDRELRPLSCRVFPLGPFIVDGRVTAVLDPRGLSMCPLVHGDVLDNQFKKAVSDVFELLSGDKKMLELLTRISGEIGELQGFML